MTSAEITKAWALHEASRFVEFAIERGVSDVSDPVLAEDLAELLVRVHRADRANDDLLDAADGLLRLYDAGALTLDTVLIDAITRLRVAATRAREAGR